MSVYKRIYITAKKQGMSVKELAKKAHIGENSIYRWKTIKPSTKSLTKVANILQVSTDYLLGQEKKFTKRKGIDLADFNGPLLYHGHLIPEKYIKVINYLMEEELHETKKNK